ncbi:MAG: flippase [Pedobacter sp.]|jgi:O-antigen/teichoic acid export membrane protein|uniref:flippase n=1 Tax=Pedobacter sp. TaxID=1411316 RepID=UPI0035616F35
MSKKNLLKNTFIYSIGEIFPKIISFLLLPVFTSYLTTSDYGIISYTNSVMFFLLVIASLALNTYLLREYFNTESQMEREKLIGNVFTVTLLFNLFLLIVSFTLGPLIVKYAQLKISFFPYFSLSILNNFFEVFSIVPLIIFRVKEKAIFYVVTNSLRAILLFVVTYVLIVHFKWGILGNFYGRLFVNGGFAIVYIFIVLRHAKLNINFKLAKKALKFSLPLIPGSIGFLLMSMSDRIILERYVSLSDIGVYSVAYTIAFSLSIIIQGGYRSFEPEIYREYGKENFIVFIEKLHGLFMTVIFLIAIGLSLFAKEMLLIMTKGGFVSGYILIPIILVGVIATGQNAILGSIIIAENKTKVSSYATIFGGVVSILFNLLLIPVYGIYSAAFATAVAYLVMNLIIIKGMDMKVRFIKFDIISILYFAFLSIGAIYFFNNVKLSIPIIMIKFGLFLASLFLIPKFYNLNQDFIRNILGKFLFKFKRSDV